MRVVVLTYHAMNVLGNEYDDNDHIALASDLALIHRLAMPIVRLRQVVDWLDQPRSAPDGPVVALSCDDGPIFDWHDFEHPEFGPQRSFANVLTDAGGHPASMTSFVIVSPGARAELDQKIMGGRDWWHDRWWRQAQASGLLDIENHSWDHNHKLLSGTDAAASGTFLSIQTEHLASQQIVQASDYLDRQLAPMHQSRLFAYPYGDVNEFLRDEYLPNGETYQHTVAAGFSTDPEPITSGANRWALPRYVCGAHWRSPAELERLLRAI